MSKFKALIIAVVVGSSSVALAEPATFRASANAQFHFGTSAPTVVVRDHRTHDRTYPTHNPTYTPGYNPVRFDDRFDRSDRWSDRYDDRRAGRLIGSVNQIKHQNDVTMFRVDRQTGARMSRLLLVSNGGASHSLVYSVVVHYANGHSEEIDVDQYLGVQGSANLPASQRIEIDIEGRARVASVEIKGLNAKNSGYSIFAL